MAGFSSLGSLSDGVEQLLGLKNKYSDTYQKTHKNIFDDIHAAPFRETSEEGPDLGKAFENDFFTNKLNNIISDYKSTKNASEFLYNILAFKSEQIDLVREISVHLAEAEIPKLLATEVEQTLRQAPEMTATQWSLLFDIYLLIAELVRNMGISVKFMKQIRDNGFLKETEALLSSQYVFSKHQEKEVYAQIVEYALQVLFITNFSPLLQHEFIGSHDTLKRITDKYCSSTAENVSRTAELIKPGIAEPGKIIDELSTGLLGQTADFTSFYLQASRLTKSLMQCVEKRTFVDVMMTDEHTDEWDYIRSTLNRLTMTANGNEEFIYSLCKHGIVKTLFDLLSRQDLLPNKSQRVCYLFNQLLNLLQTIYSSRRAMVSLLDYAFEEIFWQLFTSSLNTYLRTKSIFLLAFHSKENGYKNIKSDCFPATQENTETVTAVRYIQKFRDVDNVFGPFLVASGYVRSVCSKLSGIVGPFNVIPTIYEDKWNSFYTLVMSLGVSVIYSKDVIECLKKHKYENIIKAFMKGSVCRSNSDNKEVSNVTYDMTVSILDFVMCGYGDCLVDHKVLQSLYKCAKQDGDRTLYSKHAAISVFVLLYPSLRGKPGITFPVIIDSCDVTGSFRTLKYIQRFLSTYPEQIGLNLEKLGDYIASQDPLLFIKSDLEFLIYNDVIAEVILNVKHKTPLLYSIATLAGHSQSLSAMFMNTDYEIIRLLNRLLCDEKYKKNYTSKNSVFISFLGDVVNTVIELAKLDLNVKGLLEFNFHKHVIPYLSGEIVQEPVTVTLLWELLARMWIGLGHKWPDDSEVTANNITNSITNTHNLKHILSIMNGSSNHDVKSAVLEMQDIPTLVNKICKETRHFISKLNFVSLSTQTIGNTIMVLDAIFCFSDNNFEFSLEVLLNPYFVAVMEIYLEHYRENDRKLINVFECMLGILAVAAKYPRNETLIIGHPYIDVLKKMVQCDHKHLNLLSCLAMGQLNYHTSIKECINSFDSRRCISVVIEMLEMYTYGKLRRVCMYEAYPDVLLKCLLLFSNHDKNKPGVLWSFEQIGLGDIIDVAMRVVSNTNRHLKDCVIGYTTALAWSLALNENNIDVLRRDTTLLSSLELLCASSNDELRHSAYCARLQITGELAENQRHVDCYDSVIVASDIAKEEVTQIKTSLEVGCYRVDCVYLSEPPPNIMEKICASNFIIFIFSKDTIYSNVCRTAVHYTRRVGKAYVGIFCNGVLHHDSWQQRAIVPQNKMTLDKPAKDMFKVIRKITNQLPKVNLALIPGAYCVETQLIAEFNKFANSCEIGDVFIRDNFVGSVFDEQGGHLEVPPGEVVMYIPPGSIESGVKQPVYMYVSEYKYGEIHPGKSVLTPVVNCGPDEATFKKDILLACPHSAVKEESWKFTSLRRAACGVWENLPERSVLVNSGYVFLFLNHFTPYLTEGEGREDQSAERRIKIGLNGIFCKDTNFKIKIGAWNDVNQTQTSSWTECRPLHISANDTELRIDIKDLDETWKQRGGNSIKIIRVADISSSEEVHETYTFQYIKPGEKPDDFYCVVTATLENSKYEKEIELDVSRSADTHTVKAEDYTTKSNEEIFRALNPKWKPLDHQISAALWRKLCENLDVDRSGITDWKAIAYKLELNHDQVCNLNNSDSPTSNLLLFYFGLSRIRGWPLIHALEGLAHMCDNVKNHEARDDINNYITIRGNGN